MRQICKKTSTNWEVGKLDQAQQLLDQYLPKPGEEDLRGFEWYYLQHLLHQDQLTIKTPDSTHGMILSGDGKLIASGTIRQTIQLREAHTGRVIIELSGHPNRISTVAFSPDNSKLLSCDHQGLVKLWEVTSGKELLSFDDLRRIRARSVTFTPDGKRFAYTLGKEAFIRETSTGQLVHVINDQSKIINNIVFSPDGRLAATSCYDNSIRIWEVGSWRERSRLSLPEYAEILQFSPDSRTLACGAIDNLIHLLDTKTGREVIKLSGHRDFVLNLAYSPDGKIIASTGRDRALHLHRVADGKELLSLKGHNQKIWYVAFFPNGQHLLTNDDAEIKIWSLPALQSGILWQGDCNMCQVHTIGFIPPANQLVMGDYTGVIRIFDHGQISQILTKKEFGGVLNLAVSVPDRLLVSTDYSEQVRLWNLGNGQELAAIKPPSKVDYNPLPTVAFSPNGKFFATGGQVIIWDVATRTTVQQLSGHRDGVFSVAFSPDSNLLASGGGEGIALLWDVASGQNLYSFKTHKHTVQKVLFSPDGRWLATGSLDATIKIWDVATKQELATLAEHADEVYALAFSPDGRRLASGSKDATIRIWETQNWRELLVLKGHTAQVWDVTFSADGQTLVSGSQDKSVRVWNAPRK